MSTAETTTQAPRVVPAPMPIGGAVAAIVPQTFEEIQRVSVTIINAGIAPTSLVKFAEADATQEVIATLGKRNVAAVATCIMAGAELGLPPMVSLRAFTVINGRPALYADGNIAVVRKAKDSEGKPICDYIQQGYEVGDTDELTFAWVKAKRRDNGEEHIEQFSIADAKQAGLWDDNQFKRAKVWRNNVQGWHDDVPNDSVWHRYPRRMMMWRAAGYCLRWLFADVLGGMPDEYEAREIEAMVDITPQTQRQPDRPSPPPVPEDEPEGQVSTGTEVVNQQQGTKPAEPEPTKPKRATKPKADAASAETKPVVVENQTDDAKQPATSVVENTATGEPMTVDTSTGEIDPSQDDDADPPLPAHLQAAIEEDQMPEAGDDEGVDEWFTKLEFFAGAAADVEALDDTFSEMDVYPTLAGDEEATARATAIYDAASKRIRDAITADRVALEAAGQQSLLGNMPEATRNAVKNANTP